jgi:molybdenum cofactor cytidylyltransferase
MKFGPVPLAEAEGAILVHSVTYGGKRLRKGAVLDRTALKFLAEAGLETVVVARLEPGDVAENDAARRLAEALAGRNLRPGTAGTGRCNLYADRDGLLVVDAKRLAALNGVDEGITVSTVPAFEIVGADQIAATVKIIPFAVPRAALDRCVSLARTGKRPLAVAAFRPLRAGFIQTRLPGLKRSLLAKASGATRTRLAAIGAKLVDEATVDHEEEAVAAALRAMIGGVDLVLLLGASAIVDRRDVIPAAIVSAGGALLHFGMPVDPGNLTLFASLGAKAVIGLPGSARSPRRHGFDLVLERLAAGIAMDENDIAAMGVGGLLKEVPGRPLPRARAAAASSRHAEIAAVVLAAGRSTRMGRSNKLLADIDDAPMLRHVVEQLCATALGDIVVVTGHERERVETALAGLPVRFVHNPRYALGMSTSLKAGIAAVPKHAAAALVALGDMPAIDSALVDRLVAAFDPAGKRDLVVPVHGGRRGNPAIIGRRHFASVKRLSGDVGARAIFAGAPEAVVEVPAEDDRIFLDLDTPEALAAWRGKR